MSYCFKMLCLAGTIGFLTTQAQAQAQQTPSLEERRENKEIIIRKKTDKDAKITIEMKGDEVKVNGKPLSDFDDSNLDIDVENRPAPRVVIGRPATPRSPFRGGTLGLTERSVTGYGSSSNRAVLGVGTEKADGGVKVMAVTENSAAEKAGIKKGDIISKINDVSISDPQGLSEAIAKFKPEDKISVTLSRDNKSQKVTATLAKPGSVSVYSQNFNNDLFKNNALSFEPSINFSSGTPRLGIRAQDTEDGKGVKVLGIDKNSTAEKTGMKEGDLITEFDGKVVNGATELMEAASKARDKNNMKVKVLRDGKAMDLEIKIPKKLKTANL